MTRALLFPAPAAALLAATLLAAGPALAQAPAAPVPPVSVPPVPVPLSPVPEPLRGPWFQGECAAPAAALQVTARAVVRLPADGPARLVRFAEARQAEGWTVGTGRGAEAPRFMLRGTATALETAEPDAKLRDDRLPGDTPLRAWHRCPAAPLGLAGLHGEGISFLAALEGLEAACSSGATPEACAAGIIRQGDVSGDGKLSVAEIARMVRGATWLLAAAEDAPPETVLATGGGGILAGVAVARLTMESLDYDGDGKLSAAELAQDRAGFGGATGTEAGRPLRLEGLQEGVALLRGVLDGLLLER
ncbi:hypothetical protein [Roseomonas haemaphysalidis]|uniref:EF-hand domain-containing protein n=1 Tax=Roseomonas haemaphysalidis TaxID=2768162 RepID=A0ABS3KUH5_9PROT|nr:hypothetical protein [Roseomonas haemaphysalidis]MBO1081136.1 hypothetical protein [Roseomonas haemaphysalidis]